MTQPVSIETSEPAADYAQQNAQICHDMESVLTGCYMGLWQLIDRMGLVGCFIIANTRNPDNLMYGFQILIGRESRLRASPPRNI